MGQCRTPATEFGLAMSDCKSRNMKPFTLSEFDLQLFWVPAVERRLTEDFFRTTSAGWFSQKQRRKRRTRMGLADSSLKFRRVIVLLALRKA